MDFNLIIFSFLFIDLSILVSPLQPGVAYLIPLKVLQKVLKHGSQDLLES